jgi:hypothetical protein
MNKGQIFSFRFCYLVVLFYYLHPSVFSQPLGQEITLIDETPTFDLAGLEELTPNGPIVLGQTMEKTENRKFPFEKWKYSGFLG